MPPPFSAKKIAGTPAYKLARRQKPVELEAGRGHRHATLELLELRRRPGATVRRGLLERLLRPVAGARPRAAAGLRRAPRGAAADPGRRVHAGRRGAARRRSQDGGAAAARPADPARAACCRHFPAVVAERPTASRRARPRQRDLPAGGPGSRSGRLGVAPASRLRLLDGAGALLGMAEPARRRAFASRHRPGVRY